jgi:hypothetical protein
VKKRRWWGGIPGALSYVADIVSPPCIIFFVDTNLMLSLQGLAIQDRTLEGKGHPASPETLNYYHDLIKWGI